MVRHSNKLKDGRWAAGQNAGQGTALESDLHRRVHLQNNASGHDWDLKKRVVIKNLGSELEVHHDPDLAIVPRKWWVEARPKLPMIRQNSPPRGGKPTRNHIGAAAHPLGRTRFCEQCDERLNLIRSAEKHRQTRFGIWSCLDRDAHSLQQRPTADMPPQRAGIRISAGKRP